MTSIHQIIARGVQNYELNLKRNSVNLTVVIYDIVISYKKTHMHSLTLNLYCVLLFRPSTVHVKFSPVYFG